MAISYVNSAEYAASGSSSSYTINKPSGVQSGDLMVAVVAVDISPQTSSGINPPSGWTSVDEVFAYPYCLFHVMTRTATSSEPNSWTGTLSKAAQRRTSVTAVYRGASGFAATNSQTKGQSTSVYTGSVSNSSPNNWRVTAGAYMSSTTNYALTSSGQVERRDAATSGGSGGGAVEVAIHDSNGTISTGSHNREYRRGAIWECAGAWIGILQAGSTEIPGTLSASLPLPQASLDGERINSGILNAPAPLPQVDMEGLGGPPDGPMDIVIAPEVSIDGIHDGSGTASIVVTPVVHLVGETRQFGIRVITPERENRVVVPRLGASD